MTRKLISYHGNDVVNHKQDNGKHNRHPESAFSDNSAQWSPDKEQYKAGKRQRKFAVPLHPITGAQLFEIKLCLYSVVGNAFYGTCRIERIVEQQLLIYLIKISQYVFFVFKCLDFQMPSLVS